MDEITNSQNFSITYPSNQLKETYEYGLVITTYDRPWYLYFSLRSLRKSQLKNTIVILIDDNSTNTRTLKQLQRFSSKQIPVIKAYRQTEKVRCMMFENLQFGWDLLAKKFNCKYLLNLDPDAIVKSYWLASLKKIYQQELTKTNLAVATGFNARNHPIIEETPDYFKKKSAGGINFFFNQVAYHEIIRPSLTDLQWDFTIGKKLLQRNNHIICTKPSVVQHIGRSGIWSGINTGVFDYAIDYGTTNKIIRGVRLFYYQGTIKIGKVIFFLRSFSLRQLKKIKLFS